jgi:HlyD family secretion protein
VIVVVGGVAAAIYALTAAGAASSALTASGTVEAQEIRVAPEIAGRVAEVLVSAGDRVQAGDALLRIDDSLLQAQRQRLEAAVAAAEAAAAAAASQLDVARLQLEIAQAAARAQDRPRQRLAWQLAAEAGVDLPAWYWEEEERLRRAEAEVDGAAAAVEEAERRLDSLLDDPANRALHLAEDALARAQAAFLVADGVYRRAYAARDSVDLFGAAEQERDRAREDLDRAEAALEDLLVEDRFRPIRQVRAELAVARARQLEAALRRDSLLVGALSLEVRLAEARAAQAEAALTQAQRGLEQVRAELDALLVQLERTEVRAPTPGVVLTRSAERGEVLPAGGTALTLGLLDDLTITVFLPEDLYGRVALGDSVEIRVDSFPGEVFRGRVRRIADRAEFTPRNVQTGEGRRTTVFAIEISIVDPGNRLKPGMPADVTFEAGG